MARALGIACGVTLCLALVSAQDEGEGTPQEDLPIHARIDLPSIAACGKFWITTGRSQSSRLSRTREMRLSPCTNGRVGDGCVPITGRTPAASRIVGIRSQEVTPSFRRVPARKAFG